MFTQLIDKCQSYISGQIGLVSIGHWVTNKAIMPTIEKYVSIKQKTIDHSPIDKMTDLLAMLLTGEKSLSVANENIRSDRAVQEAFGRTGCAEQSGIQQTLNACTSETVAQMKTAITEIYQTHSLGYRHDYQKDYQILDIDMNGRPCGPKAEFATRGYFAHKRNRCGHQLGRVYATHYQEIIVDELYPGNTVLPSVLPDLVEQAETVLGLDRRKRERTILRMDGHGGSRDNVNHLLKQGYQLMTKEYSTERARRFSKTVTHWFDDPKVEGRQAGFVTIPTDEYEKPLQRIVVRSQKKNGQWGIGMLLTTLDPQLVCYLAGVLPEQAENTKALLFAYVQFYDLRSGGVETSFNKDNQPVGFIRRTKKRFEAQQMVILFNLLAHNLLVWFQQELAAQWAEVAYMGLGTFFRKLFLPNGIAFFEKTPRLQSLFIQANDRFTRHLTIALQSLFQYSGVTVLNC